MGTELSIITAVRDDASALRSTAESLAPLRQSSLSWEWIWIDASPRTHALLFQELIQLGYPISRIRFRPLGIYPALNHGIEMAAGKVLWFLNAKDRLIGLEALEAALKEFATDSALSVLSLGAEMWRRNQKAYDNFPKTSFRSTLFSGRYPCHQAMLYRKNIFERVGSFDVRLEVAADYEHHLRLLHFPSKVKCLPILLTRYDLEGFSSKAANRNEELSSIRLHLLPQIASPWEQCKIIILGKFDALRFNVRRLLNAKPGFEFLQLGYSRWKQASYKFRT